MSETTKPATGGQPETGLKKGADGVNNCLNPTTSPKSTQLFGVFDRNTMNAVIVTAREVVIE